MRILKRTAELQNSSQQSATLSQSGVDFLGRFTPERKVVLNAIRDDLRKRHSLLVLFDFGKPTSKDLTGTVQHRRRQG
jgi:hypothetical protein